MYKFCLFFLAACLSSFAVYNHFNNEQYKKMDLIEEFEQINNDEEITIEKLSQDEEIENEEENAIMTLEIEKINFVGDIYSKNSELNNIDKNIIIMKESDYPDKDNGIVIIGGHSGYGKYAYFKRLNEIRIDDLVTINYNNNIYTYKVINTYLDNKDGYITIRKNNKKNKLFLYTCNPNDKNNYLVIECEIII